MQLAVALSLVAVLAAPTATVGGGLPWTPATPDADARLTFEGRFGDGGASATIEIALPPTISDEPTTARLLTDACRDQVSSLPHARPSSAQRPLATVDLDADGRDEVFLIEHGNTVDGAIVLRVDGCRVLQVEKSDGPLHANLAFHGRGVYDRGGTGIFCRRTPSGRVEIVAIDHSPWTELDETDPANPVLRSLDHVTWTRTTLMLRGDELVTVARDEGTSRSEHDPTVPLINRFDCLGGVYPKP